MADEPEDQGALFVDGGYAVHLHAEQIARKSIVYPITLSCG